ncbi:MAG TPA: hypothetical protein VFX16_20270 [Pseudonocardiaceae bacterium]|nr:hypothetical protein [Pseudonocardiaceae bacterium]
MALIGFTGTGKTTVATLLLDEFRRLGQDARLIKLSAPLYRLQRAYYTEAGTDLPPDVQDQQLMVEIATQLRRVDPAALVTRFLATLATAPPGAAVITDDLREADPDAAHLRDAGFTVIRLECSEQVRLTRLAGRHDRSIVDEPVVFGPSLRKIPTDLVLDTHQSTPAHSVHRILRHLHRTSTMPREARHDAGA